MSSEQLPYPEKVDIRNCDKEPIHLIGKAQAHGVILAVNPQTFKIIQASENTSKFFGVVHQDVLNTSIEALIGETAFQRINETISSESNFSAEELKINKKFFVMMPHLSEEHLILDFELLGDFWDPMHFQQQLTTIINGLDAVETIHALCNKAARLMKNIFDYDRVMIYRFDEEWNGEVVAEEKEPHLESWLDLHYPASDIPAQSRNLFLKHKVRIISDVNYEPVPITPEISPITHMPLDLSRSELRGVSPIHIEYLQNMKVGASLTAAIIVNGKLWGLVACHHYSAKFINYFQRETCKFLTQVFSSNISSIQTGIFNKKLDESTELREEILEDLNIENTLVLGLQEAKVSFTSLIESGGGAVVLENEIALFGNTPTKVEILQLCDFLAEKEETIFTTKSLKSQYPEAEKFKKLASGILSFKLGQAKDSFVIWFRPEVSETVSWGGDPNNKISYNEEKQRLSPRKSFEKWTEKLDGISSSWQDYDIETAKAFRENLNQFILKKQKEEISRLNQNFVEANKDLELFSYGVSHDLRSPLRGIIGYAQILKEDFDKELSAEASETIDTILTASGKMEGIIDDILSFAKVTGGEIQKKNFNTNKVLEELLLSFNIKSNFPTTKLKIQDNLPDTYGDRRMIFQLWSNLVGNALKYSQQTANPSIEIGSITQDNKDVFYIKDNGIGIAENKKDRIFDMFSRFSKKDFKGSGVGLTIVARVLEKHNGKIWVESEPEKGSTFFFHL
ncbi:ATP-binding protein [Salegentibacter sp. Hel_I_6]|uniref:ATP-binding protein n=1 Tax=Salegentibacter sp. Hel_I_6 TaxID=1250278 RepID=UPI00055B162D|nr:ATP-binding protein [Salegentibacter sp. Hel_I_6]